ncbi:MAG: YncE family protein, partial [bacterium]
MLNKKSALIIVIVFLFISNVLKADRIVETYSVPYGSSGLAWDGNLLWLGGVGERGSWIWAYDLKERRIVDSIRAPANGTIGLGWCPQGLVFTSPNSDLTYIITPRRQVRQFRSPYPYLAGWAWDNQVLWGSTYFDPPGTLVATTLQGETVRNIPHSVRQSRDLAFHNGYLYLSDHNMNAVRVIDPNTGRIVRTLSYLDSRPYGVASDGTYLFVLDEGKGDGNFRISQILINEGGGIRLSAIAFNYGSVVVDSESTWTLWVYNDAGVTARLQSLQWTEGNNEIFIAHVWNFPQTILPGDSAALHISFVPAYPDSARIRYGLTYDLDRVTYWIDLRGKGVSRQRRMI